MTPIPALSGARSDADLLTAAASIFLPLVIAAILHLRWEKWVKTLIAAIILIAAAFLSAYVSHQIDQGTVLRRILIVMITAYTFFEKFWRPLGVADWVEKTINLIPGRSTPPAPPAPGG